MKALTPGLRILLTMTGNGCVQPSLQGVIHRDFWMIQKEVYSNCGLVLFSQPEHMWRVTPLRVSQKSASPPLDSLHHPFHLLAGLVRLLSSHFHPSPNISQLLPSSRSFTQRALVNCWGIIQLPASRIKIYISEKN